jgi:DNA-binding transcriptional LysR family regulator
MTYLLPPLNGLRAFEAAARHRSFTRAAKELHVTAGAVGQQVRALERLLGIRLFERIHGQLALTASGEAYAESAGRSFAHLAAATAALRPAHSAIVRLGVRAGLPLTGSRGLMAEIDRFRAGLDTPPAIIVRVSQPAGLDELIEGKVDMAIDRGVAAPPGYRRDALRRAQWATPNDSILALEGVADCPEIAAVRDWLLAAASGWPSVDIHQNAKLVIE